MIHDIDLILELVSAPVVKLTASGSRAAMIPVISIMSLQPLVLVME